MVNSGRLKSLEFSTYVPFPFSIFKDNVIMTMMQFYYHGNVISAVMEVQKRAWNNN